MYDELVHIFRAGFAPWETTYNNAYLGDTILYGNLTAQIGLRYDDQKVNSLDSVAQANSEFPDLLPAVSAPGSLFGEMKWNDVSPRIGLTYAIGPQKKTLVRAAYNRYVDQIGGNSGAGNNFSTAYSYLYYYFTDTNGDHHAQPSEVDYSYLIYAYGVNPDDPSKPVVQLRYGNNTTAPTTDEFILGVEHEFLPEFTVGLTYTHREMNDFLWSRYEKTQGAGDYYTTADYTLGGTFTDTLPERPDRQQQLLRSQGWRSRAVLQGHAEPPRLLAVVRRPRGHGRQASVQSMDAPRQLLVERLDPERQCRGNRRPDPAADASYGCSTCDGSTVVQGSGTTSGAFAGVYINSKWSYTITGLYPIPVIETNIGFNINGRQGYPAPYYHTTSPTNEGRKLVLLNGVDGTRLPDPFTVDLRLSKEFRFGGAGLEVSLDAFNVTDEQTVLQRQLQLYRGGQDAVYASGNHILEMVSPQIFRLGARITF